MNNLVKSIKHVQVNKISYSPSLFRAVITYEPHSTQYDESDELEDQKNIINKLLNKHWFVVPKRVCEMESFATLSWVNNPKI